MRLLVGAQMVSGLQIFCGGFFDPLFLFEGATHNTFDTFDTRAEPDAVSVP